VCGLRRDPSFLPWAWAAAILLCVRHILGLRVDEHGVHVRPRLLRGIDELRAKVPVRGHLISLHIVRSSRGVAAAVTGDLPVLQRFDDGFVFEYPDRDVVVEIELPVRDSPRTPSRFVFQHRLL
jgi:cellobiose phosphorylase